MLSCRLDLSEAIYSGLFREFLLSEVNVSNSERGGQNATLSVMKHPYKQSSDIENDKARRFSLAA